MERVFKTVVIGKHCKIHIYFNVYNESTINLIICATTKIYHQMHYYYLLFSLYIQIKYILLNQGEQVNNP